MNSDISLNPGNYSDSFNVPVFNQITAKSTCLDVGCWSGNLGQKLIEDKRCIIDGVDFQPEMLKLAKKNGYRNTYKINLNKDNYAISGIKNKYDFIIFADILEHLIDPIFALDTFKKVLKDNGKIIISLPNVAFILNRFQLLFGEWNYREFGTLDKTHLRFFTIKTAIRMAEVNGFKVVKVNPYNQFGILRYINPLDRLFPNLLCYQIMLVIEKERKS